MGRGDGTGRGVARDHLALALDRADRLPEGDATRNRPVAGRLPPVVGECPGELRTHEALVSGEAQ